MRKTEFKGIKSGKLSATMERYGIGRTGVERIAKECNAAVKVGDTKLYLWDRIDSYLAEQADKHTAKEENTKK